MAQCRACGDCVEVPVCNTLILGPSWIWASCGAASAAGVLACPGQAQEASAPAGAAAPAPCACNALWLQRGPACAPPGAFLHPREGEGVLSSLGFIARNTYYITKLIVKYSGKLQTCCVASYETGFVFMPCFSAEDFFHFNNLIFSVHFASYLEESVFSYIIIQSSRGTSEQQIYSTLNTVIQKMACIKL